MLVGGLVRSGLRHRKALSWTYPDDVRLAAHFRKQSKKVVWGLVRKLVKAGFLISPKSELAPARSIAFVGKGLDPQTGSMTHKAGALAGILRGWLQGWLWERSPRNGYQGY